ncbi:GIY-YIG nuclease family protein [Microbacterium sp. SSW1-59]|uniref:GIY-YIG nuclease family protein n=1 Tax=Microbacterium xanthum TaxID=3079794 RepID=UPI002AD372A9|nr:GIY-YIG nuclease family protein [Microbacterium sp. SSW1-59]MDZ8200235.1 GIY-YIG nuclease family protein [Microbacterium sp. SSW1-59]
MDAAMPGPCRLCGCATGARRDDGWLCSVCGWRYGDAPDDGLPPPRIDVVYYLLFDARVKIGTSSAPRQRLAAIRHERVLAFEPGDRTRERERHRQYAHLREGGEWFSATPDLLRFIEAVRGDIDPWQRYARWVGDAYRARG